MTLLCILLILVFEFKTYEEAAKWITAWVREKKNDPNDFIISGMPSLVEKGLEYRKELLEKTKGDEFDDSLIMAKCVFNYGVFSSDPSKKE